MINNIEWEEVYDGLRAKLTLLDPDGDTTEVTRTPEGETHIQPPTVGYGFTFFDSDELAEALIPFLSGEFDKPLRPAEPMGYGALAVAEHDGQVYVRIAPGGQHAASRPQRAWAMAGMGNHGQDLLTYDELPEIAEAHEGKRL